MPSTKRSTVAASAALPIFFALGAEANAQEKPAGPDTLADNRKTTDTKPFDLPQSLPKEPDISYTINTSLWSQYMTPFGVRYGDGPVKQDFLNIKMGDLLIGAWNNHNLRDSSYNETDFYAEIDMLESDLLGLDVSGRMGYEAYTYPWAESNIDHVAIAGLNLSHDKLPDIDIIYKRLFGHDGVGSGHMVHATVSEGMDITKLLNILEDVRVRLTPSVKAVYTETFFGPGKGMAHVTPGVSLDLDLGPDTSLGAYVAKQFGFTKFNPNVKKGQSYACLYLIHNF